MKVWKTFSIFLLIRLVSAAMTTKDRNNHSKDDGVDGCHHQNTTHLPVEPVVKEKSRWPLRRHQQKANETNRSTLAEERPASNVEVTETNTNSTTGPNSGCHDFVSLNSTSAKWQAFWYRRSRRPKLAYKMAILSSMAYWEFHKWPLPNSTTGFRLANNRRQRSVLLLAAKKLLVATLVQSSYQTAAFTSSIHHKKQASRYIVGTLNISEKVLMRDHDDNHKDHDFIKFEYWMYDWYEPSAPGVKFHDTDLLVSTTKGGEALIITFAGTASAADAITNIQTFEPANHSSFFKDAHNQSVQGSLHRGFLNAYSRVSRGRVLRLGTNATNNSSNTPRTSVVGSLHGRFGHCTASAKQKNKKRRAKKDKEEKDKFDDERVNEVVDRLEEKSAPANVKEHKVGGCRVVDTKLTMLLREAILDALSRRRMVHIVGHSLGGGLATLSALDIIINFPEVSVSQLHLWTFGAPQIADDIFLESAIQAAPRLKRFLQVNGNGRFHRFVTLSDKCKVDVVSVVTGNTLNKRKKNLHGRAARRFGGVHGDVVHFADPKFLLTPDQFSDSTGNQQTDMRNRTTTHSSVAAHALYNYLHGISRESKDHPLQTSLPVQLVEWIGEISA